MTNAVSASEPSKGHKTLVLSLHDLCVLVDRSPPWIHAEIAAGRFPSPRRLGRRAIWLVDEILAYLRGLPVARGEEGDQREPA